MMGQAHHLLQPKQLFLIVAFCFVLFNSNSEFDEDFEVENTEKILVKGKEKVYNNVKDYKVADDVIEKQLQDKSNGIYKTLSKEEREALSEYTQGGYEKINQTLARGQKSIYEDGLNSSIEKYILDEDLITYRGTKEKYYSNYKVGDIFDGKVFYSTSIDYDQGKVFADDITKYDEFGDKGILLEIRVPKGTKALYIGDNTDYRPNGNVVNEKELLLSNNTKYEIVEIEKDKIILEVVLDVIRRFN